MRKPFQGVLNIIRFNWHFYIITLFAGLLALVISPYLPLVLSKIVLGLTLLSFIHLLTSLLISYYIYDVSDLYELNWLPNLEEKKVLTINAGFDETSSILKEKNKNITMEVCDFYDEHKHTEVSIKRARKAYPPYPGTRSINSDNLPFNDMEFDEIIAILSAHEIRNFEERNKFFNELKRVTNSGGKIYLTEHLRDIPNFLAYTIGFFHFHSKNTWLKNFKKAGLTLEKEIKTTPFISTFILSKNGITP